MPQPPASANDDELAARRALARAIEGSRRTLFERGLLTLKRPEGITLDPPKDSGSHPGKKTQAGAEYKPDLGFSDKTIAERDRHFVEQPYSGKLKSLIKETARKSSLNAGFLAANMLAEWDYPKHWLGSPDTTAYGNMGTGADKFSELIARDKRDNSFERNADGNLVMRADVLKKIPAARQLHLKGRDGPIKHNESSPVFPLDDERALLFAVYIKWNELHVRELLARAGRSFDDYRPEFRFALARLAVNPGSKASQTITSRIAAFLKSSDPNTIVVRSGPESQSQHAIARSATRVAAQGIHLSQKVFGERPSRAQPNGNT